MLYFTFTALMQILDFAWQNGPIVEMADKLRDNGKIYVVVLVLLIILLGVLIYLIRLDNKISKLEK